ncbi:hypothetical protein [Belnapia rosea]|uniref:Uncharacterized protein n=1 Tax=Belnapia rosea TaxID=938405 RepID=A0A1G6LJA0_9PROT|nr:hypothetical protein [Belnapia rosea]SDB47463.1 hypothetical protein SAMN02927895_01783 [Belnapia rosea]SDC43331.1 hypothetical protein SAMN04487779_1001917 [Belnapia rosea]
MRALLLGLALAVPMAGQALASPCTDQVEALDRQVTGTVGAAASASSGGQGVAAARESQAVQPPPGNQPAPPSGPFQSPGREARDTQRAADAGAGGDGAIQAKAKLSQARELGGRGEEQACLAALAEARAQMGR